MDFRPEARKIGVDVIDFPVDILRSLEKDIHVNVDQADEVFV